MNKDGLAPARGCLFGIILAGLLWIAILAGLAVVAARCLP